jgi:hypothetical protein
MPGRGAGVLVAAGGQANALDPPDLGLGEPLIVHGGRQLPTAGPQRVRDALTRGSRFRGYPGALVGMKPPQLVVWMSGQVGALPGDELVDLFPSGSVGEAWRRYTTAAAFSDSSPTPAIAEILRRVAAIPGQLAGAGTSLCATRCTGPTITAGSSTGDASQCP